MPADMGELIARWHHQQQEGQTLSLAELCADCPERIPELCRHLEAVKAMESFLGLNGAAQCSPTTSPMGKSRRRLGADDEHLSPSSRI